jgi:hypothetical protein
VWPRHECGAGCGDGRLQDAQGHWADGVAMGAYGHWRARERPPGAGASHTRPVRGSLVGSSTGCIQGWAAEGPLGFEPNCPLLNG